MKFSKIRDLDIDAIEKYRTCSINVSLVLTVLFLQFFISEAVIAEISPYQAIHSFPQRRGARVSQRQVRAWLASSAASQARHFVRRRSTRHGEHPVLTAYHGRDHTEKAYIRFCSKMSVMKPSWPALAAPR
jgi:hypothetical protein